MHYNSMSDFNASNPIPLRRARGETALFVVSLIVSLGLWALLAWLAVKALVTAALIIVYAAVIALLYFILRVGSITYVRGSGARLGPDQFPELHERVQALAARLGMKKVPAAYLMQQGGALNAFATRFIGKNIVVLYTDLLEACGDSAGARDMIIAHELTHVRAGHLRLRWLLAPSLLVPFLGTALSRAREYTCDRMGAEAAGDREGALLGLSILAVGGKYAPRLGRAALAAQRRDLNTGWMTLGQWSATHPPLARRIAALDPSLGPSPSTGGTLRALSIILGFLVIVGGCAVLAATGAASSVSRLLSMGGSGSEDALYTPPTTADADLQGSFSAIATLLDAEIEEGNGLPEDGSTLQELWMERRGDESMPRDPYNGMDIEYSQTEDGYQLLSCGPDGEYGTEDDVTYEGPQWDEEGGE
jgi:Zn-dependent protease with chaperone function